MLKGNKQRLNCEFRLYFHLNIRENVVKYK